MPALPYVLPLGAVLENNFAFSIAALPMCVIIMAFERV